jgi:hypothetical protein
MQKPPGPHTGPSLQAAQSSVFTQLVRQMPFTQSSPPVQSLLTVQSGQAETSGLQIRTLPVVVVRGERQSSLLEEHLVPEVQSSKQTLLVQTFPLPQSAFFTQKVCVSAMQMPALQVWLTPQSVSTLHSEVHCPSRQTRPDPQWLLNWQVLPPPQSTEQVAQEPSTQSPSLQVDPVWQELTTGAPGTQVPRGSQTNALPYFVQSASLVQRPELLQVPLLQ